MLALEPAWRGMDRAWVTLNGADVGYLLADQEVTLGHGPTNRSLLSLIQNIGLAWRVLRHNRPDAILSTGAGLAVPFFAIGRLLGIRLVYVESVTRIETISLSGKLVYLLADSFFVHWPQAAQQRRRATYNGSVL